MNKPGKLNSMFGKHHSLETKRKMRLAHLGKKYKKMSDEGRKNISIAHFKNPNKYWLGKKRDKITIQKISNTKKNNLNSKEYYRKIGLKGAQTLYKRQPTSIEVKLYEELKNRGLLFEVQKLINGRFIVDAYIPSLNLIIEADGDYWHGLDRIKKKDKAENAYLTKCGYKLLRLSEKKINNGWSLPTY